MKNKFYLLIASILLLCTTVKAQAPDFLNYQGVARGAGDTALPNTAIGIEFIIHQGSSSGTPVYEETWDTTTNQLGLFTLQIGNGALVLGSPNSTLSTINWGAYTYYLEVLMDPTGGTNYKPMGTQQLISVPYALYAQSAGIANTGGSAGGDLSGTYPNPTVAQINGTPVSSTVPTTNQVLEYNGTNKNWAPSLSAWADYAEFQEQESSGVTSGDSWEMDGNWYTVVLNHTQDSAGNNISLANNTITLNPGKYYVRASVRTYFTVRTGVYLFANLRFINLSTLATIPGLGFNVYDYTPTDVAYIPTILLEGFVTVTSTTSFQLQNWSSQSNGTVSSESGAVSDGEPEIYTDVFIQQVQ